MATIASLSPETLAQILSYVPRDHDNLMVRLARIRDGGPIKPTSELPPYATVCKTWQWHIEQRTFREINLPSSELEYFSKLLTGYRRAALREVRYQVVLPEYDDAACGLEETEEDKKVNNAAFTTAVAELLRLMKGWEEEDEKELSEKGLNAREGLVPLSLEMSEIYSPSDARKRDSRLLKEQQMEVADGVRSDLFEERHCDSWLRLGSLEGVPELKRVTKYAASPSYPRPVEAESIVRLANKFPALKELELQIMEKNEELEVLRKDRYGTFVHLPITLKLLGRGFPLHHEWMVVGIYVVDTNPLIYKSTQLTMTRSRHCSPFPLRAPSHLLYAVRRKFVSAIPAPKPIVSPTV